MNLRRNLCHRLASWLTLPRRRRLARQFTEQQKWPAAILFYHRVANHCPNDWTITKSGFKAHLDLIQKLGRFASLSEIQAEQRSGVRDHLKVAITFDDGYRDNLCWAIPELLQRKIPVTYFVTTNNVEYQRPFAHDLRFHRHPLHVNSKAEIRDLAESGIEIGGHGAEHLDFGQEWSRQRLEIELIDSRKRLQDWTGQPINHFAFPYGHIQNISQSAIDVLYEAGYQSFSSAFGGWNFPGEDAFHLHRFHGDPCFPALRNWLSLDPRKLDIHNRLIYRRPQLNTNQSMETFQATFVANTDDPSFPSSLMSFES
jgi:peptidoglycan/xylan/chitin deacetylase (PgdA/CDA1 family)